ncbi:MAG: exopolysaccharide biosynthesis protein [Chromatiaceae bacterium]|nr:exopolysaccharide biosynthesis protein [Chromatiaceae bacterium]
MPVSFDNVLPAVAVVLLAWGLRLRDGALLAVGYAASLAAVASVVLLWWGGAEVVRWLFALVQ